MLKCLSMKRAALIILGALGMTAKVHAAPIVPEKAVNAILGEGSNQSYRAMLGIACAIRNRGTLQGVYGEHNAVVKQATAKLKSKAQRAWQESADCDIVDGCKFFGSPQDRSYFIDKLHFQPILSIGDVTFYKPKSENSHSIASVNSDLASTR